MSGKHEAGKGDRPRPIGISEEEYALRWELALGKPSKKKRKEIEDKLNEFKRLHEMKFSTKRLENESRKRKNK